MSGDVVLLAATAALAFIALVAALVAVRALRQVRRRTDFPTPPLVADAGDTASATAASSERMSDDPPCNAHTPDGASTAIEPYRGAASVSAGAEAELPPRTVSDARVVVPASRQQVEAAIMTRPGVRLVVLLAGLAHALRPESRDRIRGSVRREYRDRRQTRLRAGRAAARRAHTDAHPVASTWLGELPEDRVR